MSTINQEQALIELYNIASRLASIEGETDLSDVLQQIVESTAKVTNAYHVSVFMLDKNKTSLKDLTGRKYASDNTGVVGKIMGDKKPMFIRNIYDLTQSSASVVSERIKSIGVRSFVGIPLIVGNEVSGVLALDYSKPQKFSDEQIKLVTLFANQVAIALHHIELIRKSLNKKVSAKMPSCFISYSSKDENFSRKLYSDLQKKHVPCWYAPADMKIGDRIRSRIDKMIRDHDKLLVILSKSSLESQWVEQEVESALAIERQQDKTVLFPIRLDNSVFKIESGWATYLRNTRNIGDFSKWRDDKQYEESIKQLLHSLRSDSA